MIADVPTSAANLSHSCCADLKRRDVDLASSRSYHERVNDIRLADRRTSKWGTCCASRSGLRDASSDLPPTRTSSRLMHKPCWRFRRLHVQTVQCACARQQDHGFCRHSTTEQDRTQVCQRQRQAIGDARCEGSKVCKPDFLGAELLRNIERKKLILGGVALTRSSPLGYALGRTMLTKKKFKPGCQSGPTSTNNSIFPMWLSNASWKVKAGTDNGSLGISAALAKVDAMPIGIAWGEVRLVESLHHRIPNRRCLGQVNSSHWS